MSNTIKNVELSANPKTVVKYITLASDGTNETATIIYDSSAIATTLGLTDPLTCGFLEVYATASVASTARIKLLWDATTDVLALDIPPGQSPTKACFRSIGGLINQGGTGITGDILLTTTGLASGDAITLVLTILRD